MRTPPPGRAAQPAALPSLAPPLPPPAPLSQRSSSPFGPLSGALTPTYDSCVPLTHPPVIDFDFAPRSFPAAPQAAHTPTTPQRHDQHQADPLTNRPSLVLPLISPSVPHIAPDVGACQASQQTATKAQGQIQTPLVDTVTPFALYCSTQSPLSSPFTQAGRTFDNGDFPVGADALFSAVGINDSSPTGHYSRHQTGLDLSLSMLESPLANRFPVTSPTTVNASTSSLGWIHQSYPCITSDNALLSAASGPQLQHSARAPQSQSPLHGMLMSQHAAALPHAAPTAQPQRSPSSELVVPIIGAERPLPHPSGSSPNIADEPTKVQVAAQEQDVEDGTTTTQAGGKIWDLFPAITPQLQTHHTGRVASPQAPNGEQQDQYTMYQQQLEQHAEMQAHQQQQQHAYASWSQYAPPPSYGNFDSRALAPAPPQTMPAANYADHGHILPGAHLGATIQHLIPTTSVDQSGTSGSGMAQTDLMTLFVPSLMLPGYPKQVPVSESYLALSPVGSVSSGMCYTAGGQGKKGGASNKGGASASVNNTPRMPAAQLSTVPPPAPAMASVPVPRLSAGPEETEEQGIHDKEAQAQISLSGQAETQAGGTVMPVASMGSETWRGLGVGIGVGLGLGLSEQTSWQTLPDDALDLAQPSSYRAVFDMAAFPSLGSASANGVPMTPFPGAEWLDWPATPLKTAKSAGRGVGSAEAKKQQDHTGSSGEATGSSLSAALQSAESETSGAQAGPTSARFVSIPLYTVPGSAIDGSGTAEPTLALPPGVTVPNDVPMTGWIFDTADVGTEGFGKGAKRKRGDRGRPRGTFSSYRSLASPATPDTGAITTADSLGRALDGIVARAVSDIAGVVHRCGGSALPSEVIQLLRTTLEKATATAEKPDIHILTEMLGLVGQVMKVLPAAKTEQTTPRQPASENALSIQTQGFNPATQPVTATATTAQSAPSARVPWEEMTLPLTSTYQNYGLPYTYSAPASALPKTDTSTGNAAVQAAGTRPSLHASRSMAPPHSASSARSPPPTSMSMISMSSSSSSQSNASRSHNDGKRYTGAWTPDEVERIKQAAKDCKLCLSTGEVVVDWKAAIEVFGETRSKHQILVKAVELGLKDTTTSSNRRKKQRKHRHGDGSGGEGKVSPVQEGTSRSADNLFVDSVMF